MDHFLVGLMTGLSLWGFWAMEMAHRRQKKQLEWVDTLPLNASLSYRGTTGRFIAQADNALAMSLAGAGVLVMLHDGRGVLLDSKGKIVDMTSEEGKAILQKFERVGAEGD